MAQEQDTKHRILQTAQQMFFSQGYEKVSVNMIIEAVGIAKGTFYHHFKSKDDLMLQLSGGFAAHMEMLLNEVADGRGSAIEKMNTMFKQGAAYKSDNKELILLMSRFYKNKDNIKIINSMDSAIKSVAVRLYTKVIRQGVKEGVFDVVDPESTALYIIGLGFSSREDMLDYVLNETLTEEDIYAMEKQMNAYNQAIERLLGAPEATLFIGGTDILDKFRQKVKK